MTPLLQIKNLHKNYAVGHASIQAVNNLSLDIYEGEVFGLAGESGCGKSTLAQLIVKLANATSGQILYHGRDIVPLTHRQMRPLRQQLQIVLQDPYGSLNPRMKVKDIIEEGLKIHNLSLGNKAVEMLETVGLPRSHIDRYPRELSGGQRQRVSIARALVLEPKFIIFDESVSALDITHQKQILELLKELQRLQRLTVLFISHDLSVLNFICSRIGIMYQGELIEVGPTSTIITAPEQSYTQSLIAAIPIPDPRKEKERLKNRNAVH